MKPGAPRSAAQALAVGMASAAPSPSMPPPPPPRGESRRPYAPLATRPQFGAGSALARPEPPPPPLAAATQLLTPTGLSRKRCPSCGERYPADFRVCPRDASPLQEILNDDSDALLGSVLGDTYQLVRVIGEGGMGRVYEARHIRLLSKRFAIKVLHGDLKRQPEVVGRFLREAEATSALQHPNIVGVLDVNELPDGRPYLVVELLEGEQLGTYFEREGRLTVEDAVSICRPICQALMAAHSKGIIHRDIKPENLFLVGEGRSRTTKVLDFGISRVGAASAKLTKTGTVMGTPTYMPPEQARGRRVDQRADIYSVGAILYEALTGKRPFDGADPMSTLAAVLNEEPPRPCALVPSLPPGLEVVIQKAMAKLPKDRYRTMRELDAALAEFDLQEIAEASLREQEPGDEAESGVRRHSQLLSLFTADVRAPEQARSSLAAYSVFGGLYLLAGLVEVCLGAVRLTRGSLPLTSTEILFAALGSAGLLLAPFIVWAWYLSARVWKSTPRVLDVLDVTRHVLGASLGVYAGITILIRIVASTLHIDPSGIAWPGWGVLSFVLAAIVAVMVARQYYRARELPEPAE